MPNQFNVVDWLTMEGLRLLLNKLHIAPMFNTSYNSEFDRAFAVGDTVRVPLPQRFIIRNGIQYTPQAIDRKYTTITMDQLFGVDFNWDSVERALYMERGLDKIRREYLDPAMAQIASEIDSRCALWAYHNTNNIVGALQTTPTAMSTYLDAGTRLDQLACPDGKRAMLVSPAMQNTIISNSLTQFNPTKDISDQYRKGSMGVAASFDWFKTNNLYDHTAGTWASSVTVATTASDGATSLVITGTSGDTLLEGDVICIASVNACNPMNRRSLGWLKQFVVRQDATLTGGNDTIYIAPAMYGPGSQYQNVDALPQASAALTLFPGTTSPSGKHGINALALHGDAYALVGAKLELPQAAELKSQTRDPASGLSVRFIRMFNIDDSKMKNRFDVLCGFGNLHNDSCAVRVLSLT